MLATTVVAFLARFTYLDGVNTFTNNSAILGSGGGVYASQAGLN